MSAPIQYDIQEANVLVSLCWLKSMRYWFDQRTVKPYLEVVPADDIQDAPPAAYAWFQGLQERERRAAAEVRAAT